MGHVGQLYIDPISRVELCKSNMGNRSGQILRPLGVDIFKFEKHVVLILKILTETIFQNLEKHHILNSFLIKKKPSCVTNDKILAYTKNPSMPCFKPSPYYRRLK